MNAEGGGAARGEPPGGCGPGASREHRRPHTSGAAPLPHVGRRGAGGQRAPASSRPPAPRRRARRVTGRGPASRAALFRGAGFSFRRAASETARCAEFALEGAAG